MSESSNKSRLRTCCVPGCDDKVSNRHRFPKNDVGLFNKWLKNINTPRFDIMPRDKVYNAYRVCRRHFAPEFVVPCSRNGLRRDAYPTLYLPAPRTDNPPERMDWQESEPLPSRSDSAIDTFVERRGCEENLDTVLAKGMSMEIDITDSVMVTETNSEVPLEQDDARTS